MMRIKVPGPKGMSKDTGCNVKSKDVGIYPKGMKKAPERKK